MLMRGKKRKPKAILDYSRNKDVVDTADEMLRSYSIKVSSRRWPLAAFFNLLDIVSLNTHLICKDIYYLVCPKPTSIFNQVERKAECFRTESPA